MTTTEQTETRMASTGLDFYNLEQVPINGPHRLYCLRLPNVGQPGVGAYLVDSIINQQQEQAPHEADKPLKVYVQGSEYSLLGGIAQAMHAAKQAGKLRSNVEVQEVWPATEEDGSPNTAYRCHVNSFITSPGLVFDGVTVDEESSGRAAIRMYRYFRQKFEPCSLLGVAAFEQYAGQQANPTNYIAIFSDTDVSDEQYAYFADAPRRAQAKRIGSLVSARPAQASTKASQAGLGTRVWSGPSAAFKYRG